MKKKDWQKRLINYTMQERNNNVESIERINKFIETQFKKKNLIGISLKQSLGNSANVDKITKDAKYIDSVKFLGLVQ